MHAVYLFTGDFEARLVHHSTQKENIMIHCRKDIHFKLTVAMFLAVLCRFYMLSSQLKQNSIICCLTHQESSRSTRCHADPVLPGSSVHRTQ